MLMRIKMAIPIRRATVDGGHMSAGSSWVQRRITTRQPSDAMLRTYGRIRFMHGFKWYEIDFNWWGIRMLQLLGLARSIKRVRFVAPAKSWQLVTTNG